MNEDKIVTYIGRTSQLKETLLEWLEAKQFQGVHFFMCYEFSNEREAKRFEIQLIAQYKPYYNETLTWNGQEKFRWLA